MDARHDAPILAAPPRWPRGAVILVVLLLAAWAAWSWPYARGERALVLRDVLTTHRPSKTFGAAELARGSIPAIHATWGLGQPYRGNPNAVAFYPGNLLYLLLPFAAAFHLHYALHWLLAFLGLLLLARALGQSAYGALLAAVAWAGSGYLVSLLTFYNLITVVAWAPWAMLGLVRGGRRGLALAGLALGLLLLGGEPVTALLLGPAFVLAAIERRPPARGARDLLLAGLAGLAVAAPQLVAAARTVGFTVRASVGIESAAGAHALHPLRLLELLLPLPWGWPSELGARGFWSNVVTPQVPYVYSLHVGVIAAACALAAVGRRRRWATLAAGALLLAWAGGLAPQLTSSLTFGLFRYPQKLLVLFTLAAALLAGWGLDRALALAAASEGRRRARRAFALAGTALLAVAAAGALGREGLSELLREALAHDGNALLARTAAARWISGLALAGAALVLAAWAIARQRAALVVAAQALLLLGFAPAIVSESERALASPPPFARFVEAPRRLVSTPILAPKWEAQAEPRLGIAGMRGAAHLAWLNVEPAFGVALGLSYPLAPDLEGWSSPRTVFLARQLAAAPWPLRVDWLRRLGVSHLVRGHGDDLAGVEQLAAADHWGVGMELDRVLDPRPSLYWPEQVEVASTAAAAWARIAAGDLAAGAVVASAAVEHRAGAALAWVEQRPDRLVIDVDGAGGLLVLGRAYLPIYRARTADGRELSTQPVDVALLGVAVPAGATRVIVDVAAAPELVAGALALLVLAGLVGALLRRPVPRCG